MEFAYLLIKHSIHAYEVQICDAFHTFTHWKCIECYSKRMFSENCSHHSALCELAHWTSIKRNNAKKKNAFGHFHPLHWNPSKHHKTVSYCEHKMFLCAVISFLENVQIFWLKTEFSLQNIFLLIITKLNIWLKSFWLSLIDLILSLSLSLSGSILNLKSKWLFHESNQ